MSVILSNIIQPVAGKQQQYQEAVGKTLQHLQRLGVRTYVYRSLIGGVNTDQVALVSEYDDMTAFAAAMEKVGQDPQWLQHYAQGTSVATGSATLVSRVLYAELGTAAGARSLGAGSVVITSLYQPAPGKQQEAQQWLGQRRTVVERAGGQFSVWQAVFGGAAAGQILTSAALKDMTALAQYFGKLQGDSAFQQSEAQLSSAGLTLVGRGLWIELPGQG